MPKLIKRAQKILFALERKYFLSQIHLHAPITYTSWNNVMLICFTVSKSRSLVHNLIRSALPTMNWFLWVNYICSLIGFSNILIDYFGKPRKNHKHGIALYAAIRCYHSNQ